MEFIGFRVLNRRRAVPACAIARAHVLPVANISDVMSRMFSGAACLRPFHSGAKMAGPAITVRSRPGDNLMFHKALAMAREGDVIVIDAGGDTTNAIFGELMLAQAIRKKLGGIVINGAIRDIADIASQDLPIFALGATHRGPYKTGPGEVNVTIALDGMPVEPGDLVVGDRDGVLSVPYDAVDGVLEAAERKLAAETRQRAAILSGEYDGSWVDQTLREMGCSIE